MKAHAKADLREAIGKAVTSNMQHMVGEQQEILYNQAVLANALCILLKHSIYGCKRVSINDRIRRDKLYNRLTKITLKYQVDADAT